MGSAIFLPVRDYAYPSEISIPVAPPWPYRQTGGPTCGASNNSFLRDHGNALASSLRKVGFPLPHCQRSFRRDSASGLRACPSSHSAHSLQGFAMETFYLHASWHTRGMVMDDNEIGGIAPDSCLEDFSHPHLRGVDRTTIYCLNMRHSVAGI
jgi:hypothetical protein